jgi:tetratricopeptide (TPR) repeat protein
MIVTTPNPAGEPVSADNAGNAAALRQQGLQRLHAGGFADAIELLGRAQALDPNDAHTQFNLGVALQGAGRHAEALEHFGQVQKSLPSDAAPFLRAAASLLALGKAEAALGAASDGCRLAPRLPQALFMSGQAWLALNEPAQAEQAFAAALENAPAWAEAWVQCGVARYRQGEVEGAKTAMRQALHHAPGHRAASANLDLLMRIRGKAEASASATTEARGASSKPILSAWKPESPVISLGLAVEYLRKKPAFARLPFGEWSQVLVGQINRGHFCFIVDEQRQIRGFFGWALTSERLAEEWVEGRSGLSDADCRAGDCVIFNAWAAESFRAHRFMVDTGRKVIEGKRTLYFKRHYPDGRTRPVRLPATNFVASHLARALAGDSNSTFDTNSE